MQISTNDHGTTSMLPAMGVCTFDSWSCKCIENCNISKFSSHVAFSFEFQWFWFYIDAVMFLGYIKSNKNLWGLWDLRFMDMHIDMTNIHIISVLSYVENHFFALLYSGIPCQENIKVSAQMGQHKECSVMRVIHLLHKYISPN